jgi:DNA helicase-2/ATP-dependent DNA helicase PcrA
MALQPESTFLEKLNTEQRLAVRHGDDGEVSPLLVIAGAGSGKTNTLAHRRARPTPWPTVSPG